MNNAKTYGELGILGQIAKQYPAEMKKAAETAAEDKTAATLKAIGQAGANAAGNAAVQMGLNVEDPSAAGVVARALVKALVAWARKGAVSLDNVRAAVEMEMGGDASAAKRAIGARALLVLRGLLAAEKMEHQDEADFRRQALGEQALALVRDADLLDGTTQSDPRERREVEDTAAREASNICGARDGKGATCTLPDKHEGDVHADGPVTWKVGCR